MVHDDVGVRYNHGITGPARAADSRTFKVRVLRCMRSSSRFRVESKLFRVTGSGFTWVAYCIHPIADPDLVFVVISCV